MKKIFTLFFSFTSILLNAQFANNWIVGGNIGIDFNTSTPTLFGSSQIASAHVDNTSAISDASGNLLFYTNGINVWNKNHLVMPNGSGLIGSVTAGQCALIVPVPCNANKYVIFHVTDYANPGNLNYSVVDMSLNAGLGDVVMSQKNISLGTGWTEKLCAYYDNASNSYWVVTHKYLSNQFVSFKVDATTIAATSATSSIGSTLNCGTVGGSHDGMGQLTISPDGTKIMHALTCQNTFEIFDFNSSTGVLTNSIVITGYSQATWGVAFSPDSKKVYVNTLFGPSIFQHDLNVYTSAAINASKYTVYTIGSPATYNYGYMELAPDGKIYIPRPNTNFFAVVNSPNLLNAACSFTQNGFSLGSLVSRWGACRIAYNIPTSASGGVSLTANTINVSCNGMANGSATIVPSPAGSYNYLWSPGSYTNSTINALAPGNYTVSVTNGPCINSSTIIAITQPSPISLNISPSQMICNGATAVINSTVSGGTPAYSYSWSNGSTFSGVNVSPSITKNYTLFVTDANGCLNSAVSTVSVADCTNINESMSSVSNLELFPNPTSDFITVSSQISIKEIVVVNYLGQQLSNYRIDDVNAKINLNELPKGVYFLEFHFENKTTGVKKVIKTE